MTDSNPNQSASAEALRSLLERVATGEASVEEAHALLATALPNPAALDDVSETVHGLIAGIEEFKGVMGQNGTETERLLKLAQRRFAIQVSATMLDEPISLDTQATASTSIKRLRDELVLLAARVSELVESTIRDSQARKELEIAGTVQQMLVPSGSVNLPGLQAAAWFRPADQCSGDWWSLARLGQKDALLVVGDVTGHGAPAAIIAGAAKGAFDMARVGMRDALKPFMAMNMLNHILLDSMRGEYFMTAVVARVDIDAKVLRVSNAGHRPPWIFRAGTTQTVPGDRSAPLGVSRAGKYTDEVVQFQKGDVLVVFTDGIPEAESPSGQQFGERQLRDVCERAAPGGPQAICDAVRAAVEAHVERLERLGDDVTLVALQAI